MAEERLDYAVLISLSMREEAEVMASALRAEGIDAFIGNLHHATWDWGHVIALGGLQVLVPRQKLEDARQVIRERISEAAANPEGETVGRRDRWKAWAVLGYGTVVPALIAWLPTFLPVESYSYVPGMGEVVDVLDVDASSPDAVRTEYCQINPSDSVMVGDGVDLRPVTCDAYLNGAR